eukprot:m.704579 g.704579  ORF g.704579 m.704579 type:complete len:114 (-) comp58717_c1_seq2:1604-1945(-)
MRKAMQVFSATLSLTPRKSCSAFVPNGQPSQSSGLRGHRQYLRMCLFLSLSELNQQRRVEQRKRQPNATQSFPFPNYPKVATQQPLSCTLSLCNVQLNRYAALIASRSTKQQR